MKKTLYTLSVNDYEPEITKLTFPLMKKYAEKIDAEFHVIKDRKFPDFPCPYEKFQISQLSQERGDEWSFFFDADALIHPDMWDPTCLVSKAVTISNGTDLSPIRFKPNKYFNRDGRNIGKGNWCMIGSDWTAEDLWRPHDCNDPLEIAKEISVTMAEKLFGIDDLHLVDDYTVSLNIARYGLQHVLINEIREAKDKAIKAGTNPGLMWHIYLNNSPEKIVAIKRTIMIWVYQSMLGQYSGLSIQERSEIETVTLDLQTYDGSLDWSELISILPFGKKVANTIYSWGIEMKYRPLRKISYEGKRLFLFTVANKMNDQNKKGILANSAQSMPKDVKFEDFLNTLDSKDLINAKIKAWGLEL
jgi:hypothetical protein